MSDRENSIFIKLLKKHTNIDEDFIDIFFKKFKIGGELDFNISDSDVARFLNITMKTLKRRLNNSYSNSKNYIENVDYIKIKVENKNKFIYMINYPCFEKLAMNGDSEESETIRMYFIKLRQFLTDNQELIYQAIENKEDLKKYSGFGSIYFFAVDDKEFNWKIGRTNDIIKRLRVYNVGKIKDVELKYLAIVKNPVLIEKCIKLKLKDNQVFNNKEIYKVSPKIIKK
jgi:phage anti-repressor protein